MQEKSMFKKWKNGEITQKEYNNWWAQKKGFKDWSEYRKQYYQNNKDKLLTKQNEYNKINRSHILDVQKERYQHKKEQILEYQKQYRYSNKVNISKQQSKYYQQNKERLKVQKKHYYQDNKNEICKRNNQYRKKYQYNKIYYQNNKEKELERNKQYNQTPKGILSKKLASKKTKAKRKREFGYNILNKDDSINLKYVGHHLDKINVLYIPKELHKSIFHKQLDIISMQKINSAAIDWYIKHKGFVIKW